MKKHDLVLIKCLEGNTGRIFLSILTIRPSLWQFCIDDISSADETNSCSGTSKLWTPWDHAEVSTIGGVFIRRVHPVMCQPFPVAVCHVIESWVLLECREALKHGMNLQEQKIFFNSFTSEICIDFISWGVTTVSIIQSREVSAIQWSQCMLTNREWFGTVGSFPHCGGFRNRVSPLLEVPLYYLHMCMHMY